jgi:hypothetical protein
MNQRKNLAQLASDLKYHAAGCVVRVQGSWPDEALKQFRSYLGRQGLFPSEDELRTALEQAKEQCFQGESGLYLCGEQPCRDKMQFDFSDRGLEAASKESGVPVSLTGCQGPCKQAPVLSLRVRKRWEVFAQVVSSEDWETVLVFANRASAAGTLLIDLGPASHFRFDPVHQAANGSVHLKSLRFLLGHFEGEGRYAAGSYSFQKEVIGTLEADGRCIALRMGASYPLSNGGKDVHRAFVVVGAEPSSGKIEGRAYTDGGLIREYSVQVQDGSLEFDDIPPGHGSGAQRARKVLKPLNNGFEERLEVENGAGVFVPYYVILMRRVQPR